MPKVTSTSQQISNEIFTLLNAGLLLLLINFTLILFTETTEKVLWYDDAGTILWMIGFIFWIIPLVKLRKAGGKKKGASYINPGKLVTTGIYKYVRHPQCVGFILFDLGFIGITQQWIPSAMAIISILFIVLGTRHEDKNLSILYGKTFEDYRSKVPAFNLFGGIIKAIGNK